MKSFNYHEPATVAEACRLLADLGSGARIIAGGTDLLIQMKRGAIAPPDLVSIKGITCLNGIAESADGFSIGASTPLAIVAEHPGIKRSLPMVAHAALSIGSAQVRNRATIGGNICNAAPSADMAPGLLVLETRLTIAGSKGKRELPLSAFFTGPGTKALERDEIVEQLFIPRPAKNLGMVYIKHGPRRAMDCAVVGVAMCLNIEPSTGIIQEARIALGAVAPTPVRAAVTERLMQGNKIAALDLSAIEVQVRQEVSPISDVRASADYRYEMVSVLTTRAIESINSTYLEP